MLVINFTDGAGNTTMLDVAKRSIIGPMDDRSFRHKLAGLAYSRWGGSEGKHWAIANREHGIVRIIARHRTTGETFSIDDE